MVHWHLNISTNNENNVYNTVYNSVSYQKELTYLAYGIGFNCIEL